MNTILGLLAQHGPVGLALIGGLVAMALHQKSDSEAHGDMETRLRTLEKDHVVKEDITRVYDRVEKLSRDLNDGHREILNTLLARGRK